MPIDRYQRHSLIDWFSQADVKAARIAVIGVGAVGNELVKNLVLLGVGAIDLFDFDTIEVHNLTRSVLFREEDIGRRKAEAAANRARQLDPNVQIRAFCGDVWQTLTIDMLRQYDAVVACVDNFETRIRLNTLCLLLSKNLVNTGIDSRFASVEIYPFASQAHGPCYECNLPLSAYERAARRYSCGWLKRASFIEKKIPTTVVTASTAAALATSAVLRFGKTDACETATHVLVDTIGWTSTRTSLVKNEQCAVCGWLSKPVSVVGARNMVEPLGWPGCEDLDDNLTIRLSDQIVTTVRCTSCDPPDSTGGQVLFERASRHDSSLATCSKCGQASVMVDIRDQFTIKELLTAFQGRKIDSKYAVMETPDRIYVLNMEESGNE